MKIKNEGKLKKKLEEFNLDLPPEFGVADELVEKYRERSKEQHAHVDEEERELISVARAAHEQLSKPGKGEHEDHGEHKGWDKEKPLDPEVLAAIQACRAWREFAEFDGENTRNFIQGKLETITNFFEGHERNEERRYRELEKRLETSLDELSGEHEELEEEVKEQFKTAEKKSRKRLWITIGAILLGFLLSAVIARAQVRSSGPFVEVQDESTRVHLFAAGIARINYLGAGVSCAYNGTTKAVDCTITGSGGAGGYDVLKGDTGTATRIASEAAKFVGTANQLVTIAADSTDDTVTFSIANPFIFPGKATFAASTTSAASANFPTGSAPTVPTAGDIWRESDRLKFRDSTTTQTLAESSDIATWANEEGVAGTLDGVNTSFSINFTPSPLTSLRLILNGLTLRSGTGNDFTIVGTAITMLYAPTAGSNLIAWYTH